MRNFVIRILAIVSICFVVLAASVSLAQRPLPQAKLMAVYFYADWCGNCKVLGPKLEEAKRTGALEDKDVLFVVLDLSNKTRIHQSILQGQALGIGDYLREQGSATGYVAVLDAETKKEIQRFTRDSESKDIVDSITKQLQ